MKHWRRTLSIQKRLREHLIVQKYYDKSPDYRRLAKEILEGRKKSAVGLLDKNKEIVKKYDTAAFLKTIKSRRNLSDTFAASNRALLLTQINIASHSELSF